MSLIEKIFETHSDKIKDLKCISRPLYSSEKSTEKDIERVFILYDIVLTGKSFTKLSLAENVKLNTVIIRDITKSDVSVDDQTVYTINCFDKPKQLRIIEYNTKLEVTLDHYRSVIAKDFDVFSTKEFLIYASMMNDVNKVQKWIDHELE